MDSTTYPFSLSWTYPWTYKVNGKEANRDYSKDNLVIEFEIEQ
ncbi:MAG: hypothetical protein PUC18_13015 [Prevotellaceae bacterium]|nr:hypothetical protein [Prevotellaceae bacterium]